MTIIKKIKAVLIKNFSRHFWKSSFAIKWHQNRDNNDFELFAQTVYDNIKDVSFDVLIEIGCGAGDLVSCLSKKLTDCKKFVGVDINKTQINKNIKKYKYLDNIEFVYADIEKYIENNNNLGDNVMIVSQNSLEYFKKDRLEHIFAVASKKYKNLTIIISTYKKFLNLKDSHINTNHSFTIYNHNYYALLQATKYKVRWSYFEKKLETIIIIANNDTAEIQ